MKDNIVTVEHLSFTYKDSEEPAVKDVSFSIPKGTWTTFWLVITEVENQLLLVY